MQISLAKPPTENKQKEKRKQMQKMQFAPGSVVSRAACLTDDCVFVVV